MLFRTGRGLGSFCLFQDGSSAEEECNGEYISLIACCFSVSSLAWHLVRKGILTTCSSPRLCWSSYDQQRVKAVNNSTAVVTVGKGVEGQTVAAAQGSFSHASGCHSWLVSIDTPERGGDSQMLDQHSGRSSQASRRSSVSSVDQKRVLVGVCDASGFDPVFCRGGKAWGIDPSSRLVYATDDANGSGRRLEQQPFTSADDSPNPCSTIRICLDMNRRKLYLQLDGGITMDTMVRISDDVRAVSAWCLVGGDVVTLSSYVYESPTKVGSEPMYVPMDEPYYRPMDAPTSSRGDHPAAPRASRDYTWDFASGRQSRGDPSVRRSHADPAISPDHIAVHMEDVGGAADPCASGGTFVMGSSPMSSSSSAPRPTKPTRPMWPLQVCGAPSIASHEWAVPSSLLEWGREIGHGGFGTVHEVRSSDVTMAAKKMSFFDARQRDKAARTLRHEFRALASVHHENVVKIFGVVVDDPNWCCLLMELAPCGSLRHVLDSSPQQVLFSMAVQLAIAQDIVRGMAHLHQLHPPIFHRDLKAANVLLWEDDESVFTAKLADFGMATGIQSDSASQSSSGRHGAGTLSHKAPEAFNGIYTSASEVYAFAITLWELLTGARPWQDYQGMLITEAMLIKAVVFGNKRPPLVVPPGRAALGRIIQSCWAPTPSRRPSFAEVERKLKAIELQEAPSLSRATGFIESAIPRSLSLHTKRRAQVQSEPVQVPTQAKPSKATAVIPAAGAPPPATESAAATDNAAAIENDPVAENLRLSSPVAPAFTSAIDWLLRAEAEVDTTPQHPPPVSRRALERSMAHDGELPLAAHPALQRARNAAAVGRTLSDYPQLPPDAARALAGGESGQGPMAPPPRFPEPPVTAPMTPRSKVIKASISKSEQQGQKADSRTIASRILRARRLSRASDSGSSRASSLTSMRCDSEGKLTTQAEDGLASTARKGADDDTSRLTRTDSGEGGSDAPSRARCGQGVMTPPPHNFPEPPLTEPTDHRGARDRDSS